MFLAIDCGNTLTKGGLYQGEELVSSFAISTAELSQDPLSALKNELGGRGFSASIASVVVASLATPLKEALLSLCSGTAVRILQQGERGIIEEDIDDPSEVGADILADLRGAKAAYGYPAFIADLGTADKYILLGDDGAFKGMAIDSGLTVATRALGLKASALEGFSLLPPKRPLGKNTAECLSSGFLYGRKYSILGFANAFQKECKNPLKLIITGGNAPLVAPLLPEFTFDPHLSLKGLLDLHRSINK